MQSTELNQRAAAVRTSLLNLSNENCALKHHHAWRHGGLQLPACEPERANNLMGCPHGNNLALRAAIILLEDLSLISPEEKRDLISFLSIAHENLFLLDDDALLVTDKSFSLAVREKAASDLGAELEFPETIEVALEREQGNVIYSLDLLRQAALKALDYEHLDLTALRRILGLVRTHLDSMQRFELTFGQFNAAAN